MRAYMAALLEVSGMMSGQGFALRKVLNHISTHLEPKVRFPHATLREAENGLIYVTQEGHRYFSSRLSGEPIVPGQHVTRREVIEMIKKILAEQAQPGWEQIEAELEEELH
jgi:hypothetical protein